MTSVLNAQKKRCRKIWLENCEKIKKTSGASDGRASYGLGRAEPPMASLEQCLDQAPEPEDAAATEDDEADDADHGAAEQATEEALSMVIASLPQTQVPVGIPPTSGAQTF